MERIIIDGLSFSLPLFIMAVGGIYSEKSGITNLALEGFQGMGAFTGALAAVIMMNMGIGNATTQFYALYSDESKSGHQRRGAEYSGHVLNCLPL